VKGYLLELFDDMKLESMTSSFSKPFKTKIANFTLVTPFLPSAWVPELVAAGSRLPVPTLNSSQPLSETGTPTWLLHEPAHQFFNWSLIKTDSRWKGSGRSVWPPTSSNARLEANHQTDAVLLAD
jgi:hypothetical protein